MALLIGQACSNDKGEIPSFAGVAPSGDKVIRQVAKVPKKGQI